MKLNNNASNSKKIYVNLNTVIKVSQLQAFKSVAGEGYEVFLTFKITLRCQQRVFHKA